MEVKDEDEGAGKEDEAAAYHGKISTMNFPLKITYTLACIA